MNLVLFKLLELEWFNMENYKWGFTSFDFHLKVDEISTQFQDFKFGTMMGSFCNFKLRKKLEEPADWRQLLEQRGEDAVPGIDVVCQNPSSQMLSDKSEPQVVRTS